MKKEDELNNNKNEEKIEIYDKNKKAIDNTKVNYNDKTVIIVGNEHSGISKLTEKNSDELITINMYGNVQSLNVSVAAGILIYEAKNKIFKNK